MTHNSTIGVVVASPVASFNSDEYLLALGEQPEATAEEIEAACEALERLEARHKEQLTANERLHREMLAAEVAKNEQSLKVDAVIKKVEADIVARFRSGLAQRGGQRVLIDAVKAKELASRFEVTAGRGDFSGALAALKALRQGTIAAGVMYHFGSVRNQDEFLYRAEEEVKRLRSELSHKKRGKRRT